MAEELFFNQYLEWSANEGVPTVHGWSTDPANVELGRWERKGVNGALLQLEARGDVADGYVIELPPQGNTRPEHHMFEELIYVLSGRGATSVWTNEGAKQTFEWQEGSLFAVPLNAWAQHFNGAGDQPARFLGITNAPLMMNLFHNLDFIYGDNFVFHDRMGDEGFFKGEGKMHLIREGRHWWETNFVPDARSFELLEYKVRGAGGVNLKFNLANSSMHVHMSDFPVGTYKKGHTHGPGAHILMLSGEGFSLIWPDGYFFPGNGKGFEEAIRIDWKPGLFFVPKGFHQHFNTGTTRARYLAMGFGGARYYHGIGMESGGMSNETSELQNTSVKLGGRQIEYEDENPEIHKMFEADLAKNGVACRMKSMVPWCTGEIKS